MDFNKKINVFGKIIIRYDNETYFDKKITMINFYSKMSGFDIAKIIEDLGLIYKEGGILKFQSGGSTNIWDTITWDLGKRYRNVYNNGTWELSERGNTVNTNNIYNSTYNCSNNIFKISITC